jgi:peptidoglycan/LPS O-acetylase OafA/YrhL
LGLEYSKKICGMNQTALRASSGFADSKPHYEILDGLRGTAALLVVVYHIFEGLAFAAGVETIWFLNHGYLAVDFFFILSGFVIGYAYDDRLASGMTTGWFIKRRLIRLHPMIVMGGLIGVVAYLVQGGVKWDGTPVAISLVMLALLCDMFMIPATPGSRIDVRGNGEMFSLNGPSWSLFFEYIGNLLYVLFIHRISTKALKWLVALTGIALAVFCLFDFSGYGMLSVGWTLDGNNFIGGFLRMLFPYSLGMLMARVYKPKRKSRGAFWIGSGLLLAMFLVPYIPGKSPICWNAVYELFCIMVVFPVIVCMAASGHTTDTLSTRICFWLGDLSYPLYAIHYPVMYVFYAWLIKGQHYHFSEAVPQSLLTIAVSLLLAWLCLKLYDIPVRKWLSRIFIYKKK